MIQVEPTVNHEVGPILSALVSDVVDGAPN